MLTKYLAARGLRLTTFSEFMLPTIGLLTMAVTAWCLIWIFS